MTTFFIALLIIEVQCKTICGNLAWTNPCQYNKKLGVEKLFIYQGCNSTTLSWLSGKSNKERAFWVDCWKHAKNS